MGISLISFLAVKLKISSLSNGIKWLQITGAGIWAGIGFTMSIFIALLSFNNVEYQIQGKFSILVASILAGIIGYIVLKRLIKKSLEN